MAIPVNQPHPQALGRPGGDGFSDIRKILRLVLRNWYLFVIFVPLGLGSAWVYHRYTVPVYRASITMLFKVDQERNFSASVLTEGFGLSPEMRSFENQSFIIRNHAMVLRAVNRLDFGVSYFSKGRLKDSELYDPLPFVVAFDSLHPQLLNTNGPILPNKKSNYSKGLMAGLILPALIIALRELFNTRIRDREDLEGHFRDVPIVGEILRAKDSPENVVIAESNSVVAESFRSLRARLRFLLAQNPGKIISVTSTNTGDGKTFCAVNLATAFALTGKKTALVGFDLRKPRLSQIFGLSNMPGISNYLIGQVSLDDIRKPSGHENLCIIPAGVIPPNPSELISSAQTQAFFQELRAHFDIVIVDTPPVGLVSDGRLLMDLADCHLFVVRSGVTEKEHFNLTMSNLVTEGVKCMGLVLNDVTTTHKGYGYYTSSGYFN